MSTTTRTPSMAAVYGDVVTEAHATWCAEHGHSTYVRDGVDVGWCPRCGATLETLKALMFVAEAASNVEVARGLVNDDGEHLREVVTVRVLPNGTTEARYPLGFFERWSDALAETA